MQLLLLLNLLYIVIQNEFRVEEMLIYSTDGSFSIIHHVNYFLIQMWVL